MTQLAHLVDRGVVEVAGRDRVAFLQGLVSNDVALVAPGRAVWAALLTPQGKWLADFFILGDGERLLLDCERAQAPDIVRRLARFRLRAEITLRDVSDETAVHVAWGGPWDDTGVQAPDPRLIEAGRRIIAGAPLPTNASAAAWDLHRLSLGLPDGSRDLDPEKTVLLEAGFDELHGISWTKGCYMGQELTARTRYRGLIKRRLWPVTIEGALPEPGTPITSAGREVGIMRSGRDQLGLALLRLDALDQPLTCGGARLTLRNLERDDRRPDAERSQ